MTPFSNSWEIEHFQIPYYGDDVSTDDRLNALIQTLCQKTLLQRVYTASTRQSGEESGNTQPLVFIGGAEGDRTLDLRIAKATLCVEPVDLTRGCGTTLAATYQDGP
jgi:hypothetical protein